MIIRRFPTFTTDYPPWELDTHEVMALIADLRAQERGDRSEPSYPKAQPKRVRKRAE
jgi:hypothetical protein